MQNQRLIIFTGFVFALFLLLANTLFIVSQKQQAVIFQFREVVRVVNHPGLHLKVPFLQSVGIFESRVLSVDSPSQEIMLSEQKPLEVDAFARYRITDPLLFLQRLKDERMAYDRLSTLLNTSLRSVLGTTTLGKILSPDRVAIMARIKEELNAQVRDFGVEIVDVRIRRTELPQKTSDAVFARMRSQREQEAEQIRSTGKQEALQITADADRQATIIQAEAQGKAEKLKGEGDRKALEIMAESTSRDPQFFAFWRTLTAYREGLKSDQTTYVLGPDSEFFRYFNAAPTR